MSQHLLYNAYLSVNGVALSGWTKTVRVPQGVESLDDTAMGDTTRTHLGGLKTWSVEADLEQDYASSAVDQTLNAIVGTVVAIEVRPDAGSVSATNPKWTGNALVKDYQPIGGTVGELHMTRLMLESAGPLTRATS